MVNLYVCVPNVIMFETHLTLWYRKMIENGLNEMYICPPSCMSVLFSYTPVSLLTEELHNQGVQDVFVFCTRGELHKYRVPSLLEVYQQRGFAVHHMPFQDGDAPELEQCCRILKELQVNLENNRRTVIQ